MNLIYGPKHGSKEISNHTYVKTDGTYIDEKRRTNVANTTKNPDSGQHRIPTGM